MSNDTGKWLPMNLDGSFHSCKEIGTKNVSNSNGMVSVPIADLKKMLEFIEGVEGIKHRLGVALGVEK